MSTRERTSGRASAQGRPAGGPRRGSPCRSVCGGVAVQPWGAAAVGAPLVQRPHLRAALQRRRQAPRRPPPPRGCHRPQNEPGKHQCLGQRRVGRPELRIWLPPREAPSCLQTGGCATGDPPGAAPAPQTGGPGRQPACAAAGTCRQRPAAATLPAGRQQPPGPRRTQRRRRSSWAWWGERQREGSHQHRRDGEMRPGASRLICFPTHGSSAPQELRRHRRHPRQRPLRGSRHVQELQRLVRPVCQGLVGCRQAL